MCKSKDYRVIMHVITFHFDYILAAERARQKDDIKSNKGCRLAVMENS